MLAVIRDPKEPPSSALVTWSAIQSASAGCGTFKPSMTVDCGAPARSSNAKPPVLAVAGVAGDDGAPFAQPSNAFLTPASSAAASNTPAMYKRARPGL